MGGLPGKQIVVQIDDSSARVRRQAERVTAGIVAC
jgi:hypothetical protein